MFSKNPKHYVNVSTKDPAQNGFQKLTKIIEVYARNYSIALVSEGYKSVKIT